MQYFSGKFEYFSNVDRVRVRLEKGQLYNFSGYGVSIQLLDAHGQPTGRNWVEETGDYWLALSPASPDFPAQYTIRVEEAAGQIPPTTEELIAAATPLAEGTEITATSSAYERRFFAIDLVAGQSYTLQAWTYYSIDVAFYESDGDLVTGHDDFSQYTATTSGIHYAAVLKSDSGNFTLAFNEVADDIGASFGFARGITLGAASQGVWETWSDSDWHKITLVAGKSYLLDLDPASESFSPIGSLRVLNAAGNQVWGDPYGTPHLSVFSPDATGVYYVAAEMDDRFFDEEPYQHQYSLTVSEFAVDFTSNILTTGALSLDAPTSSRWDGNRDVDWMRVDLTAGETYRFRVTSNGSPHSIGLYDASGHVVVAPIDYSWGPSQMRVTSFETGTYYLSVTLEDGGFGGDYTVSSEILADDQTDGRFSIEAGGAGERGIWESAGESDLFGLDVRASTQYRIDLEGEGSIVVRKRDGTVVTSSETGSALLNPVANEGYFIEVTGAAKGEYLLKAVVLNDDFPADETSEAVVRSQVIGTAEGDRFVGSEVYTTYFGQAGDDFYIAGFGWDRFVGSDGIDTVSFAHYEDGVTVDLSRIALFEGGKARLLIYSTENVEGTAYADTVTGNSLSNLLKGGGGHDLLDGLVGADRMEGGKGNDRFIVDNVGDAVVELEGEGSDAVDSSVTFSLAGAHVETLRLTGDAAINGTGNGLANTLTGNGAANLLKGLGGDDRIDGGLAADTMEGGLGNDRFVVDDAGDKVIEKTGEGIDLVEASVSFSLAAQFVEKLTLTGIAAINGTGNGLDNLITGNNQANLINGAAGADEMIGRKGDDTYVVDNALDKVVELDGEGSDTVNASVNYSLAGQYAEVLNLTGAAVNGTGNGLANRIVGNDQANNLNGGAGNDRLDGGVGADTMAGGLGNDVFVVDNVGDKVGEKTDEGTDTVEASISYSLAGQYVEVLRLTGAADLNGTGNGQANSLFGNAGANRLDGQGGADEMAGGAGSDLYVVDNAGDKVVELAGEGTDSVQASVTFSLAGQYADNLSLTGSGAINGTGNGLDNALTGNGAANTLSGGAGNDLLNGGAGSDRLAGGAGADVFVFDTGLGAASVDQILDFAAADDTVRLDRSVFGALTEGMLNASAFAAGTAAKDADDRIVFDKASGDLWYDADGSGAGAAVLFANFGAGEVLSAADFVVVA